MVWICHAILTDQLARTTPFKPPAVNKNTNPKDH